MAMKLLTTMMIAPAILLLTIPSSGNGTAARELSRGNVYLLLTRDFPGAIKYSKGKRAIEFCPDNTCHRFEARKDASREDLSEFLFIYLRYYSDYLTLSEWRQRETTSRMIERIMARPTFAACRAGSPQSQRLCAIQTAVAAFGILGYDIRYDEGEANIHTIQLSNLKELDR
jgi:hypothetical protein